MKYLLALLLLIPSMAFSQQSIQGTPNGFPVAVQGVAGGTPVPISGTVTSTVCTTSTCSETVVPAPSSGSATAVSMVQSAAYETSHVIKASAGNFYGMFGYNSKTSAQFIQCFNSATVPADTAVPIITFTVPASSNYSLSSGVLPINFSTGISCSNSSTGPTKTIGSADTWFNVLFN